jgi:hypothetical protein
MRLLATNVIALVRVWGSGVEGLLTAQPGVSG